MDYVLVHILVVTADTLHPPQRLGRGAESLDHLAGPYLCEYSGAKHSSRGETASYKRQHIAGYRPGAGGAAYRHGKRRAGRSVECYGREHHAHKAENFSEKFTFHCCGWFGV